MSPSWNSIFIVSKALLYRNQPQPQRRTHPSPHRVPAVMALLMAAVSSVTPSPVMKKSQSTFPNGQYPNTWQAIGIGTRTFGTIVRDVAKNRIARRSVGSHALVGNVLQPPFCLNGKEKRGKCQQKIYEGTHGSAERLHSTLGEKGAGKETREGKHPNKGYGKKARNTQDETNTMWRRGSI